MSLCRRYPSNLYVYADFELRHQTTPDTKVQSFRPRSSGSAHPNTGAAVLSLCAAAVLFAGYSSVGASLVLIGATAGLSVQWVGRLMALSLLASLGGAIAARGVGERTGVLLPLCAGAGVLGGDMLVITLGADARLFIGGAIVLFMCIAGFVSREGDFTRLGHAASLCVVGAVALFLCGERLRLPAEEANPAQAWENRRAE